LIIKRNSKGGIILKRIFTAAGAVLLAMSISTGAFAHSHLEGSNPADGDIVTEPLNEIVLEFDGQIEQGSYIDVTTAEGEAFEPEETIIGDGTLTASFAEPLANDEYQVTWSIISADGHPMEGEFSFTVNASASEQEEGADEEPSESPESVEEPSESTEAPEQTTENQEAASADEGEENESSSMTVILIVLLAAIAAGSFFLFKRKK
jgi:methionine-rich copper-binding protein CopC